MKIFPILLFFAIFSSCIKVPKYQPPTTIVDYSFDTGEDMGNLFDFMATYVDKDNNKITERITSFPWDKQIVAAVPFNANLEVVFSAKNVTSDQETFEVGFKGAITQLDAVKATKQVIDTKVATNDEVLRFSITLPAGISPNDVNLSVAPLKYNKHFAFTLTVDDSHVNAWSRIFPLIHRKWVDDIEFFHQGIVPTTGSVPNNTLSMTDGCGNDRRFGFGVGICPTLRDDWHKDGRILESSTSKTNPYITWEELRTMLDFGCAVHYHNVDETMYDKTTASEIVEGLEKDYNKVVERLGRKMKVLALPDGNKAYIEATQSFPKIEFIRSSSDSQNLVYLNRDESLKGVKTYGGNRTSVIQEKSDELDKQAASANPYWVGLTVHRPQKDYMDMIEKIYNQYGKAGTDNIWVASWDEIYEYKELRHGAKIIKNSDGQTVTFEVELPTRSNFDFHDISFVISGVNKDCRVVPISNNIYGLSQSVKDGKLLLNVNFNPELLKLAEKYTAKYELYGTVADKDDAMYFVSMLRSELASPFISRIEQRVDYNVVLESVTVNAGANTVYERDVLLNLKSVGNPTMMRIGEKADLSSSTWEQYRSEGTYKLSGNYGNKTIYVQIKNNKFESIIVSVKVSYANIPEKGTIHRDAVKAYQQKYDGHKVSVVKTIKK